MHRDRLIHLRDVTLPKAAQKLKMSIWFENLEENKRPSCATTACALGWAALDPYFNKLGLKIYKTRGGYVPGIRDKGKLVLSRFSAAQEIFGLTGNQSLFVFGSRPYRKGDIEEVQEHINEVLASEEEAA